MIVAVVAEKPQVARDIARVLGATRRKKGYLEGGGYAVTWAVGHLVALCEPAEMDPRWKRWHVGQLPMLPRSWDLQVLERTQDQFEVVRRLINEKRVERVVCATDAGREGELIFRYIYQRAGCKKPVQRLWISSLTTTAIRNGFSDLQDGSRYQALADAAQGRSRADWLVGMNLSRAYTLMHNELYPVGRVQTPTLAMLVQREKAVRDFVPEPYTEVVATFGTEGREAVVARGAQGDSAQPSVYRGTYFRPGAARDGSTARERPRGKRGEDPPDARLPADGVEAAEIVARALAGDGSVESVERKKRRKKPPLLHDLTELQREANRLLGFSADQTLKVAQALYERHKLLSYPRTDSRHLTQDVAETLPRVVAAFADRYGDRVAPGTGERMPGKRVVDDSKVTDHHAIIPTTTNPASLSPGSPEARIYDLVCRRLLAVWHQDHVWSTTNVVTRVENPPLKSGGDPLVDRYRSSGTTVERIGWRILDLKPPRNPNKGKKDGKMKEDHGPADLPPGLEAGQAVEVLEAGRLQKTTRPPRRFSDASLLTAMETAGKTLDDKAVSAAMRERGLGTPATRAATIEGLLQRSFVERHGKALHATDRGIQLVDLVHDAVKSPAMTGRWERRLKRIERGQEELEPFLRDIETYVTKVVAEVVSDPGKDAGASRAGRDSPNRPGEGRGRAASPVGASGQREAGADSRGEARAPDPRPHEDNGPHDAPDPDAWRDDPQFSATVGSPERRSPPPEDRGGARSASVPRIAPAAEDRPVTVGSRQRRSPRSEDRGGTGPASAPRAAPAAQDRRSARAPSVDPGESLDRVLTRVFGHQSFRPHQEAVCRAALDGDDVLLVMPTGAGKSLCYQLPGLMRPGVTLVISPLIALMEDQVAALQQLDLRAERIHSGRGRLASREVCHRYLDGDLDFLFIAPERLGVPGFPEFLARGKLALVTVDEAHCISQWGHDFRPDYRMLHDRLPLLGEAPTMALTATATPMVQRDIVEQLGVSSARQLIHGFRRDNIAVEVAEMRPGLRHDATAAILGKPDRLPAIVYAPTRKETESLAGRLSERYRAAPYHAGLLPEDRDRTQEAFLAGGLDVIVATIAFGMGIDKPDIRTVIHMALPGSVEGYYQEIGRAGRDGKPSRAVLLHAYVDRRTHEYFMERDYPDPAVLSTVYRVLDSRWRSSDALRSQLRMDPDVLQKVLEQLWIHGGAEVDPEENVRRKSDGWREPYMVQRQHRVEQLDRITQFADHNGCRMLRMVDHFGDQEDSGEPCGQCDICAPEECLVAAPRPATAAERAEAEVMLTALADWNYQSTGKVFREQFARIMDRRKFEGLLGDLARAGLITLIDDAFEKGGRMIQFRRVSFTEEGWQATRGKGQGLSRLTVRPVPESSARKKKKGGQRSKKGDKKRRNSKKRRGGDTGTASAMLDAPEALVRTLKEWRLAEAKEKEIPAFRILTDRTLGGIAVSQPADQDELLAVKGIGPTLARKYGETILDLVRRYTSG